jgi:hypothetical protein
MDSRFLPAILIAIGLVLALGLAWLSVIVVARSRQRVDLCPSCNSNRIRPSWPRVTDVFLSISSIAAFRCEACLKRFYGRKSLRYR